MLERAKKACPGLSNFIFFMYIILIAAGVITFLILMFEDTDLFVIALSCLFGGILTALMLYLEFLIAAYFYGAAVDKGYPDPFYLKLAFWIPVIGYLLVIALPNRGGSGSNASSIYDDSLPDL